ncbi:MAG: hypothetical protein JWO31_4175 [Phycisphaerales bacterium]|nr:hypothetical protein [Phycisphaerales bacterium]
MAEESPFVTRAEMQAAATEEAKKALRKQIVALALIIGIPNVGALVAMYFGVLSWGIARANEQMDQRLKELVTAEINKQTVSIIKQVTDAESEVRALREKATTARDEVSKLGADVVRARKDLEQAESGVNEVKKAIAAINQTGTAKTAAFIKEVDAARESHPEAANIIQLTNRIKLINEDLGTTINKAKAANGLLNDFIRAYKDKAGIPDSLATDSRSAADTLLALEGERAKRPQFLPTSRPAPGE